MKRIVLDMSVLVGVNQHVSQALRDLRDLELVVTVNLFEELYTHEENFEPYSRDHASANAYKRLSQVCTAVPVIQSSIDPIRFEIENGRSASTAARYNKLSLPESPQDLQDLSEPELQIMLARKKEMGELWKFKHPRECEQAYMALRNLGEDKNLWPRLVKELQKPKTAEEIRKVTIERAHSYAMPRGLTVRETFAPDRSWLSFGFVMTEYVYMMWKYARHGDETPADPANTSYDMTYIAHMAICDGILSCDKTLLNMAWTCWFDKRENILTYDSEEKRIITYKPDWEK